MHTLIFNQVVVLHNVSHMEAVEAGKALYEKHGRGSWSVTESKNIIFA